MVPSYIGNNLADYYAKKGDEEKLKLQQISNATVQSVNSEDIPAEAVNLSYENQANAENPKSLSVLTVPSHVTKTVKEFLEGIYIQKTAVDLFLNEVSLDKIILLFNCNDKTVLKFELEKKNEKVFIHVYTYANKNDEVKDESKNFIKFDRITIVVNNETQSIQRFSSDFEYVKQYFKKVSTSKCRIEVLKNPEGIIIDLTGDEKLLKTQLAP